jgi:hypothetical protein
VKSRPSKTGNEKKNWENKERKKKKREEREKE